MVREGFAADFSKRDLEHAMRTLFADGRIQANVRSDKPGAAARLRNRSDYP